MDQRSCGKKRLIGLQWINVPELRDSDPEVRKESKIYVTTASQDLLDMLAHHALLLVVESKSSICLADALKVKFNFTTK